MTRCLHDMRTVLAIILTMVVAGCFAQGQTLPMRRVLSEDVEPDSIKLEQISTNSFVVRFTYTESGAKKLLTFRREYAGHEAVIQVGSFERRTTIASFESRSAEWTEEGWLKRRTDKFFGVSEEDAKSIVEGLKRQ